MNITLEEAYDLYISSKSAILSPSTIYNYENIREIISRYNKYAVISNK